MSGKGNCYDNAAVETFFKTIKAELIWRRTWETRRQAETALAIVLEPMANKVSLPGLSCVDRHTRIRSGLCEDGG